MDVGAWYRDRAMRGEKFSPGLTELMAEEPSNINLEQPSGLTIKRLEQIRADGRARGLRPVARARAAG